MTVIVNQLALAFFNLINSRIDAYRILKNKTIAHAINFGAYAALVTLLIFLFKMYHFWDVLFFCIAALCNRQLSFDIPLNLRRGLPWYYQSTANPPKSEWDKFERIIFGSWDGKKIAKFYSIVFGLSVPLSQIHMIL